MIYRHEKIEKRKNWNGPRPGFPRLAPSLWSDMENYLLSRHLSFSLAKENGWYGARYKGRRIVIPCSNSAGIPYFQAREMGDAELRYASPPASREDSIVMVWPHDSASGTVICEGPMDALAAAEFGFLGIAIMGNDPSEEVLEHIRDTVGYFEPVWVVPDLDHLEMGPVLMADMAMNGISGCVLIPPKKDLSDMTREQRKSFLTEGL